MIWKTTMLSKSLKWQFQNNQMTPVPKPTNWPMASAKWPMPSKTKPDSKALSSCPLKPASALKPPAKNKTKTTAKAAKAA